MWDANKEEVKSQEIVPSNVQQSVRSVQNLEVQDVQLNSEENAPNIMSDIMEIEDLKASTPKE